jgi:uncharacterized protein (DUF433 family)
MNQFHNIVSDTGILGGKPCIRGTRISVQLILEWMSVGTTIEEIVAKYPHLTFEGVQEAVSYNLSKTNKNT